MKNFIIHLPNIPASLETATNLKDKLESFGETVELFEGTDGNTASNQMEVEGRTLHQFGFKGPDFQILTAPKAVAKMSTPGVKGCFYSHYRLWEKCVALDEPVTIWEDDIVLTRPFIKIEWEDILVVALGHPSKSERYMHYLLEPTGDPVAAGYKNASMPGCCGYAIHPHAASKLITTYKHTYLPADNAINQHHVKIQIHNHIMGIALTKKDGKKSLTRTNFWSN
jgi:glycosyl transferase family 25